jgi:hypothetical protein
VILLVVLVLPFVTKKKSLAREVRKCGVGSYLYLWSFY